MNARDDEPRNGAGTQGPQTGQGALAPPFSTSTKPATRTGTPVSATRQRKLHVGHFAFMRSVVQGLDPRESWERYFRVEGEATDQRTVRATIAWIRDEFAAAAKRQDRYGTARLVRIDAILDELLKHGHVIAKNAYGDWTSERLKNWPDVLDRLAIRPQHQFARTSGKNATDIAMVIDAMDMFHSEDFDAFAIVSSDSDFTGLASRLRRGGKYVFGFGEEKTPVSFRNACDDFILTEYLGAVPATNQIPTSEATGESPEERDIIALLKAAASEFAEGEGWTLTSHAGNTIKRQRPDFSPKVFGCRSLGQVISKFDRHFELKRVARGDGMTDQYRERPTSSTRAVSGL